MVEPLRVAWAAGFVDGEGCISYPVRIRERNRRDYNLTLYVGQVDPRPLYRLRDLFGGTVVVKADRTRGRNRPMHMWRITGTKAQLALQSMLPHLIVKRHQAELALALRESIRAYVQVGRRVDDAETAKRLALVAALKADKWRDHREEVMPNNA